MKILVDTNVLLSAALRNRLPERVVMRIATDDQWKWLVTAEILSEYTNVLRRPKFALTEQTIQQWFNPTVVQSNSGSICSRCGR
jgi:uncharacterized protein